MTEWSRALDYATARKWSKLKSREHPQIFYFLDFILRNLQIFAMRKSFTWQEGWVGIFKNKNI